MAKEGLTKDDDRPRKIPRARMGMEKANTAAALCASSAVWAQAATGSRERFTMDEGCSRAVKEVFVQPVRKGPDLSRQPPGQLVPRAANTPISDAEVEYAEQAGQLLAHLLYPV